VVRDGDAASCRDLVKTYWTETGDVPALQGISVDFPAGAITAVVGASGSGKSSLLRILAGLDRPTSGTVRVGDLDIGSLPRRRVRKLLRNLVGYVFQSPGDNFVSYLTVMEHLELAGRNAAVTETELHRVLEKLGIAHRSSHLPHELSGGEQQRAAFAQVLVAGVSLVVADEPTAELDDRSAHELLETVQTLSNEGVTFIVATHDAQVAAIAEQRIEIEHGHLGGAPHEAAGS
jgi:putative ABC transport system ATP-binding protein